jgi:hypothetical protein
VKPAKVFQEFEKLAEDLGIRIIQEKGNFQGGYCLLEKEDIIVVNKLKPLEQRNKALAAAFSRLEITGLFLKPVIRDLIEAEQGEGKFQSEISVD